MICEKYWQNSYYIVALKFREVDLMHIGSLQSCDHKFGGDDSPGCILLLLGNSTLFLLFCLSLVCFPLVGVAVLYLISYRSYFLSHLSVCRMYLQIHCAGNLTTLELLI